MMNRRLPLSLLMIVLALSATTTAAGQHQEGDATVVRQAIEVFLDEATVDGKLYLHDQVDGKLLALTYDGLHEGVQREGVLQASCADFTDQSGRKLDVDFVVVEGENGYVVTEAILHKVDGEKRPYSLKVE